MSLDVTNNNQEKVLQQEKVENIEIKNNQEIANGTQYKQEAKTDPKEETEDPNWKAFREGRKQDRLQREIAEKKAAEKQAEAEALKAALEAALNKPQPQHYQQQGYYQNGYPEEETEDQRIEKKVQAALAARESEYEKRRMEREKQEYPQRLAKTYPDFMQVVTDENVDYLTYHYPEIANPLKRLPEDYDKWEDIYKALKKFVPNKDVKSDAAKAQANMMKPRSISSAEVTQTGQTSSSARLTEERRAANWERMQKIRQGLS